LCLRSEGCITGKYQFNCPLACERIQSLKGGAAFMVTHPIFPFIAGFSNGTGSNF
jgi:hypothetical protein